MSMTHCPAAESIYTGCPPREELYAYHIGTLPEERAAALIEHLGECPACQAAVETFGPLSNTFLEQLRSPAAANPYEEEPDCHATVAYLKAMAESVFDAIDAASPAVDAPLGQLGDYQLLAKLGEGGMGAVYKARQVRLDKIVALKVLPKDHTADPAALARFDREMKAVGRVDHPNIVRPWTPGKSTAPPCWSWNTSRGWTWARSCSTSGHCRSPTPAKWSAKRPSASRRSTTTDSCIATSSPRT